MPHIQELPTTAKAAAPGWSYVVDTGYDPSKAAINPSSRKRVRASVAGLSQGDLTIRQQTAIQRHLDDLDKDSHKPVNIAPPKSKTNRRQTQNTRRILASGKDFSHYLDQDEAALASKQHHGIEVDIEPPKPPQRASKTPIARRKPQLQPQSAPVAVEQSPAPTAAMSNAASTVPSAPLIPDFLKPYLVDSSVASQQLQHDSLLSPPAPLTATTAEIEALLSAPQLSYNAARSAPTPATAPPQRVFCEMCGYWGRVKCLKCGSRVCGLECKSAHEESRCIRF